MVTVGGGLLVSGIIGMIPLNGVSHKESGNESESEFLQHSRFPVEFVGELHDLSPEGVGVR